MKKTDPNGRFDIAYDNEEERGVDISLIRTPLVGALEDFYHNYAKKMFSQTKCKRCIYQLCERCCSKT
jgi:hypothetical protein